jgi:cell division septation protein DedD
MKNNETGEFELVLGNRHLLSGFFIVALLFGVAFAMGYIVGRSSTPSPKMQAETAAATATQESRPQPAAPAPAAPAPEPSSADAQQPATDVPAQPLTQPAKDGPAAPAPEPAAPVAPAEDSGTYWQVSAQNQSNAAIFAKTLKDKGFPVTLSPGPNNLTRVLVGPYPDAQLGRAKSELENAGFHPILLKK